MSTIEYPDVEVDADGLAVARHIASHHVRVASGGGEVTLCGVLITYQTWQGTAPDAPACVRCVQLDA